MLFLDEISDQIRQRLNCYKVEAKGIIDERTYYKIWLDADSENDDVYYIFGPDQNGEIRPISEAETKMLIDGREDFLKCNEKLDEFIKKCEAEESK